MTTPSRTTLREWTRALTLDEIDPYDPAETRYVPLDEAGRGAVDGLRATIELSIDATTQLLSGPTGSGKTTELLRLRGELAEQEYIVTLVNIKDYVNESSPIDVTEFLIALAIAASDAYDLPMSEPDRPRFTSRLGNLLRRLKLDVDVAGVKVAASGEAISVGVPGASAEVSLKAELKSSQPFVDDLRSKLSYHVGELYEDVADFLAELSRMASAERDCAGSVLIIDGLEKLQGTSQNDKAVQESIERLFVSHASKLKFASHHVVYTVPTYLLFTNPGALPFNKRWPVPVPAVTPRVGPPAAEPPSVERTRAQLREVVGRRIPSEEVFGADLVGLDTVISASGGHLRDLFTLLNQLISLILRRSLTLPLGPEDVDEVLRNVAYDFGSVTQEQLDFLKRVRDNDGTIIPRDEEVGLMARLLQTHMLLSHLNGTDWYEVHPLARRALGLDDEQTG